MAYIQVQQGTVTWLPYISNDVDTGDPRTGIVFSEVAVSYKKSTQSTFTVKAIITAEFRENGSGVYEVSFSAAEMDTLGTFLYIINGNGTLASPAVRQFVGSAFIVATADYTPGAITLDTNVLTGNIVDAHGVAMANVAISARVVAAPTILGVDPNIGGVGSDIVSALTDSSGFFALEVLQGAVIDISIPRTNYRRTLTVPDNATDTLFNIA